MAASSPSFIEPFPIFRVAKNFLLYDVDVISHVRRHYNICGILIGTLSQVPQQNVFLGLPVQLMPEEARVLVEAGHAYIADDVQEHKAAMLEGGMSAEERLAFQRTLGNMGQDAARAKEQLAGERKEKALKNSLAKRRKQKGTSVDSEATSGTLAEDESESALFPSPSPSHASNSRSNTPTADAQQLPAFAITPTISYPPLRNPDLDTYLPLPEVPTSYPLFKYLHQRGYFMMPGLRFGCQYNVYPGDPLRFHSHFLGVGKGWDDDIRMMEIVGGGRLGTGVKKAFMVGGKPEGEQEETRAFCFEWAGM